MFVWESGYGISTDKTLDLLYELKTDSRDDNIGSIKTIEAIESGDAR